MSGLMESLISVWVGGAVAAFIAILWRYRKEIFDVERGNVVRDVTAMLALILAAFLFAVLWPAFGVVAVVQTVILKVDRRRFW